ncbi:MAG: hypothetical protein HQ475_00675 [SAR202 cluster bacterium]|nr:hypothetical protein [SAR202 cluster bacterium]
MRWLLEVTFIGLTSSWKWVATSVAVVGTLVGILFAFGVFSGGGGGGSEGTPPLVVSPTPIPAATALPDPTATPAPRVISVPILATKASNVGSLEFVLVYDPAKLEFAQVERGALAGNALIDSSSPGPGRLWAGIIDVQGFDGSGPIAVVKFTVRREVSGSMPFTLEDIAAFDASTLVDIVTVTTAGQFNGPDLSPLSPIVTFQ